MRPISLHGHQKPITRVKFNKDGDLLVSTAKDNAPTVWNAETGERLGTYEGHRGAVWDCDINYSSTLLATAGADECVKIWDLLKGECVATIAHKTPVRCVGFSHGDDMLLTVTDTSYGRIPAIHVYNLPPGGTPEAIKNSKAEYNPWCTFEIKDKTKVTCALWGPSNDTIYFSCEDGTVSILNLSTQDLEKQQQIHNSEIRRICFDKNYVFLMTASLDQTGKLVDALSLKVIKTYESDKPCNDCGISPLMNHVILGGGQDAQSITNIAHRQNKFDTRFFHMILEEELGSISGHFGPINSVAFASDGRGFATGGEDGFVKLYRFDTEVQ
jgi:translation initiation factor 3 subunit I